jgi:hypothetical protein
MRDVYEALVESQWAGETGLSATLSTASPKLITLGLKPGLRSEKPVTNSLNCGGVFANYLHSC